MTSTEVKTSEGLHIVLVKDLKKSKNYILTWDFWPKGGSTVTLVRREPYRLHYPNAKGDCALVADLQGNEYVIAPGSYLFEEAK